MITKDFDVNTYELFLDPVLCTVLNSWGVKAHNFESWLQEKALAR